MFRGTGNPIPLCGFCYGELLLVVQYCHLLDIVHPCLLVGRVYIPKLPTNRFLALISSVGSQFDPLLKQDLPSLELFLLLNTVTRTCVTIFSHKKLILFIIQS